MKRPGIKACMIVFAAVFLSVCTMPAPAAPERQKASCRKNGGPQSTDLRIIEAPIIS